MNGGRQIENFRHLDAESIKKDASTFDLIICAQSVEKRCTKIPSMLNKSSAKRIALSVCDMFDDTNSIEQTIKDYGFLVIPPSVTSIEHHISEMLASVEKSALTLHVFIDVTCMPRRILAQIVGFLSTRYCDVNIDLAFGYALAKYSPPPNQPQPLNKRVAPCHPLFAGWTSSPGRPTTTIVGLGYEKDKALGAVEYIQASDCFLLIPDSPERKYRVDVDVHNAPLISASGENRKWNYEVMRPVEILLTLGAVISSVKQYSKPVLLPFGPKIFFAVSLLAALIHPEASVWSVSGEELEPSRNKAAAAHTAGLRCLIKVQTSNHGA
jgi:hypothetical protein